MADNVLTITLNPTVDKSCTVPQIVAEKKLRCSAPVYEPGGGGINVARGLTRLAIPADALFTSGGRTGVLLESLLEREKVGIIPVPVSGETRENFIAADESNNQQFRFGMPGEEMSAAETQAIIQKLASLDPFPRWVVISGSLPPGMGHADFISVIEAVKTKNARLVVDTSGSALKAAVEEGVYLLKPNMGELSSLVGVEELDNASAEQAAKQLIDQGKAEAVAISMGAQGACLVTRDQSYYANAPAVKKRSTVGAGDSMVAGMLAKMAAGSGWQEVIHMGVACGTAATMNPGTALFNQKYAEKLYQWVSNAKAVRDTY